MNRRLPVLAVALLLCSSALAGCEDSGGADPDPTVPTAAPTSVPTSTSSTTAAPPDVTVVPAVIDEPYVDAVLAALDEIDGQATRMIVATKTVPKEALDLLRAILDDDEFLSQAEQWADEVARKPMLDGLLPNPGNRVTTVERIISASPACLWVAVSRDRSPVNVDPGPRRTEYLALQPLDRSHDPTGVNRTPWMVIVEGMAADGSEPANPCPAAG